jgi:hypothetical protein
VARFGEGSMKGASFQLGATIDRSSKRVDCLPAMAAFAVAIEKGCRAGSRSIEDSIAIGIRTPRPPSPTGIGTGMVSGEPPDATGRPLSIVSYPAPSQIAPDAWRRGRRRHGGNTFTRSANQIRPSPSIPTATLR